MTYEFRDMGPYKGPADTHSPESITVDGVELEEALPSFTTLSVSGRELLDRDIITTKVGNRDGEVFRDSRRPMRTITVDYQLTTNSPEEFRHQYEKLATILGNEQVMISFADRPEYYYTATFQSADKVNPGRLSIVSSMVFLCSDPYAYAKTPKTFTNTGNIITINNGGNCPTPVSFNIESQSDNGFISLVSPTAIIQAGRPNEVDGHTFSKSQRLFNETWTGGLGTWQVNKGYLWGTEPGVTQSGTVATAIVPPSAGGFQYHKTNTTDWGTGAEWSGPSLYKPLPADDGGIIGADNWEFYAYGRCRANSVNDTGIQEYNLHDASKNHVAGVRIVKNGKSNKHVDVIFYVGEAMVWHAVSPNWDAFTGTVLIRKMADKVSFTINNFNSGKQFTFDYVKAGLKAVTGVTYWNSAYKVNDSKTSKMEMYNMLMYFTKMNVTLWDDDPNTFKIGDRIRIDSTDTTVRTYLNETQRLDLQDLGSRPILAPMGTSEIIMVTSDFATRPKVTAVIQERLV